MVPATVRWTVSVSQNTDIAVRTFLAQRGMKRGDLSQLIEEAVRWRVFDQTMAEARGHFSDLPTQELKALLGEAVTASRQVLAAKSEQRVRHADPHRARFPALTGRLP